MNKPRKLAMGPLCGQLAISCEKLAMSRRFPLKLFSIANFSLLFANWQRYALIPLLIAR
jgi:hypothetical protein